MIPQKADTGELILKLDRRERQQIKQTTGEDITELQIGTFEACGQTPGREAEQPEPETQRHRFSRLASPWDDADDTPSV
jgi:hypothetical protein